MNRSWLSGDGIDRRGGRSATRWIALVGATLAGTVIPSAAAKAIGPFPTYVDSDTGFIVSTVDLNNDGRTDIVTRSNTFPYQFFVRHGQANGSFGPADQLVSANGSSGFVHSKVEVGDFNGDGAEDLLAASATGCTSFCAGFDLVVFYGGGPTTPVGSTVVSAPTGLNSPSLYGVEAADVNGDGRTDIVQGGNPFATVRLSQPDGSFFASTLDNVDNSTYATVTLVADADGGGVKNDIIVSERRYSGGLKQVVIHYNASPTGNVAVPMESTYWQPLGVSRSNPGSPLVMYLSRDEEPGDCDGSTIGDPIFVRYLDEAPYLPTSLQPTGICAQKMTDLDGDGLLDFTTVTPSPANVPVWQGTEPLDTLPIPDIATTRIIGLMFRGDVNGDGFADLITRSQVGGAQSIRTYLAGAPLPIPTLRVEDVSVLEGNTGDQTVSVPVTLSIPAPVAVTFHVSTFLGSGNASADDVEQRDADLVIPAGTTSTTFDVVVHGDTAFEADEYITIGVSVATVKHATVEKEFGTLTFRNDDAQDVTPPVLTPTVTGPQGLNGWYTGPVDVRWTVSDPETPAVPNSIPPSSISGQGTFPVSASSTSEGGTTNVLVEVKIDSLGPSVTWTGGPADGGLYLLGTVPAAPTCMAVDTNSGPGSCVVSGRQPQ